MMRTRVLALLMIGLACHACGGVSPGTDTGNSNDPIVEAGLPVKGEVIADAGVLVISDLGATVCMLKAQCSASLSVEIDELYGACVENFYIEPEILATLGIKTSRYPNLADALIAESDGQLRAPDSKGKACLDAAHALSCDAVAATLAVTVPAECVGLFGHR